jgi:murein DD-endopeptidase MepM/ murein hydrolase activator NlpD
MRRALFLPAILGLVAAASAQVDIALPTDNRALLDGRPGDFYQFIDRDFEGVKTAPWEGGQFGFVRDPRRTAAGLVYRRFHEGMDIKPVRRDARGWPLDDVRAIAAGRVVHASETSGASNYGRYVVIEHRWGGCPYYSLYAHLNVITTRVGATVAKGGKIGVLGFTGDGIDMRRAHLHLEVNTILSDRFEEWHRRFFPADPNRHGLYNGLNLSGLDVARLLLAAGRDPSLTIPGFLAGEEVAFKAALPWTPRMFLLRAYPWLLGPGAERPQSMEISFNASGLPLRVTPRAEPVAEPALTFVKKSAAPHAYVTRDLVVGSGPAPRLSESGMRYMALLLGVEK